MYLSVAVDSFGYSNCTVAGAIAWNHRWEHEKGIDLLLDIVTGLIAEAVECQFNLSGQQFRQIPDEMTQVIDLLQSRGGSQLVGFIESGDAYCAGLTRHRLSCLLADKNSSSSLFSDAVA